MGMKPPTVDPIVIPIQMNALEFILSLSDWPRRLSTPFRNRGAGYIRKAGSNLSRSLRTLKTVALVMTTDATFWLGYSRIMQ